MEKNKNKKMQQTKHDQNNSSYKINRLFVRSDPASSFDMNYLKFAQSQSLLTKFFCWVCRCYPVIHDNYQQDLLN